MSDGLIQGDHWPEHLKQSKAAKAVVDKDLASWAERLSAKLSVEADRFEEGHEGQLVAMERSVRALTSAVAELGVKTSSHTPLVHLALSLDRLANGSASPTFTPIPVKGRPKETSRSRQYGKAGVVFASEILHQSGLSIGEADQQAARLADTSKISGLKKGAKLSRYTVRDWRLTAAESVHVSRILEFLLELALPLLGQGANGRELAKDTLRAISKIPGVVLTTTAITT